MKLSVIDPLTPAWDRTVRILFRPFELGKWFLLGFCAFLALLGQQSGNFGNFARGGGGVPGGGTGSIADWIVANIASIVTWGLAIIALLIAVISFFLWLQSRGRFMFIDGVVRNRGAVVEPWKMYAHLANSLFVFSFLLLLLEMTIFIGIAVLGVALAWPDLEANEFGRPAIVALSVSGGLFALGGLIAAIISSLIENFIVPTMYVRNIPIMEGWATFWHEVGKPYTGAVIVFMLAKLLLNMVISTTAMLATCATCCIPAIPYIGTVILLPLFVFPRCYSICFLEQIGPSWQFFVPDHVRCRECGYDLRANQESGVCPECGFAFHDPPPPGAPPTERPTE